MEIKNILASLALPLGAMAISTISLYISFQNRKNAIREHLYKEQMKFFTELLEQIAIIGYHFEDVVLEKKLTEEKDELIEKEISKLDKLFDKYVIIVPDENIFDSIQDVIIKAYNVSTSLIRKEDAITGKDAEIFYNSHDKLIDELREFIGVEMLSKENQNLYARKIKNEASEARKLLSKV